MDEYPIEVAGLPARANINGDGYFVNVAFQNVFIAGSPLVVHLNPPVATIEEVGGAALLGLVAAIASGAVIRPF